MIKFVDDRLLSGAVLPAVLDSMFSRPTRVGLFVAVQAIIGSIAIAVAPRLSSRLRLGRMYVFGMLALGIGFAVVSTMGSLWAVVPARIALGGVGWVNVAFFTLRQKLTPTEMLGRVIAASRTLSWALIPVGAVAGGWAAESIGLVPVYLFGSLGVIAVATVLLATPLYASDGTPTPSFIRRAIIHASPSDEEP